MATTKRLSNVTVDILVRQIGEELSKTPELVEELFLRQDVHGPRDRPVFRGLKSGVEATLKHSFEVWALDEDHIADSESDASAAHPTMRWHHQIHVGSEAVAYARSMTDGPGETAWSVQQLTRSPLAKAVDSAISLIDENDETASETRLLTVPSVGVDALWLHSDSDDRVVVVRGRPPMIENRFYSWRDFVRMLMVLEKGHGLTLD